MRGARLDDAVDCVTSLYGMIPMGRDDGEAATLDTVELIAKGLVSEPLWAIKAACRRVLDSGTRFRPGAPELLALARADSLPFRREAAEIARLLGAKVLRTPPPEERARVAAGFSALLAEFPPAQAQQPARGRAEGPMSLGEAAMATMRSSA